MEHDMSREYHFIKTPDTVGYEQALVAAVVRDEIEQTISVDSIYILTTVHGSEIKSKINVENMFELIANKPGGNIPKHLYNRMYDQLEGLIDEEEIKENEEEIIEQDVTRKLILASEKASTVHPIITDFDEIIKNNK